MGKHLSAAERDLMRELVAKKKLAPEVHAKLVAARRRRHQPPLDITTVRRHMRGTTFKVGVLETQGRKRVYSKRAVLKMNKTRQQLIKTIGGDREVHWKEIVKQARVAKAHPTTTARAFTREGIAVARRVPRHKPLRGPEHLQEREQQCKQWKYLSRTYFTDKVDLIMDNKMWKVPGTLRAKKFLSQRKVRFHLRTPSEGLSPGFTKPCTRKHRLNTGGQLLVVAGIIGCRVRVWHYVEGKWNGTVAANTYANVLKPAIVRYRGEKGRSTALEDNDPTGYKSKLAKAMKASLGIQCLNFPRYSPDLNPLDYFVWEEVESRMQKNAPPGVESVDDFKKLLRRTALAVPESVIRKGVADLVPRVQWCAANGGLDIPWD